MKSLFLSSVLAALCTTLLIPDTSMAEDVGLIKVVSGAVTIRRDGSDISAYIGGEIREKDVILTGSGSAFGAILDDGTTISLGAESGLEIVEFTFEPSEGRYDLMLRGLSGRIVYGSGRIGEVAPERVRIETPYLSLGTRGTRFAIVLPESGS